MTGEEWRLSRFRGAALCSPRIVAAIPTERAQHEFRGRAARRHLHPRRRRRRSISRPPRDLRRPQLRGACARDGQGPDARAAVLLHQARRRHRAGRFGGSLSAGDQEPSLRNRAGRRHRQGRLRHPRRAGARPCLRLRRRHRPDAPRPAIHRARPRPALGLGQGLRQFRADLADPAGDEDRPSREGPHLAVGQRRDQAGRRHFRSHLERAGDHRLLLALDPAEGRRRHHDRHARGRRTDRGRATRSRAASTASAKIAITIAPPAK